tara:strand:+ start:142 stop:549 length:408 start_codon:yes stop_codon:yes gene_type:complete
LRGTLEREEFNSETVNEENLIGVSGWARLGAYVLDYVLFFVTLVIGWIIWALSLRGTGQTPARKMMNQRVWDLDTNAPMSHGKMFLMRGIVGGLVEGIALACTLYILAFMPFWDKKNQTICDKVSSSLVVETSSL